MVKYVAIILSSFMIWFDCRTKSIPLLLVLGFGACALIRQWFSFPDLLWLGVSFASVFILMTYALIKYWRTKQLVIGSADCLVLPITFLWFPAAYIPPYLVLTGALGVIWGMFWRHCMRELTFPFLPPLIISWWVLMILDGDIITRYSKQTADFFIEFISAFWPTTIASK